MSLCPLVWDLVASRLPPVWPSRVWDKADSGYRRVPSVWLLIHHIPDYPGFIVIQWT